MNLKKKTIDGKEKVVSFSEQFEEITREDILLEIEYFTNKLKEAQEVLKAYDELIDEQSIEKEI